jgi:hypothetical protein
MPANVGLGTGGEGSDKSTAEPIVEKGFRNPRNFSKPLEGWAEEGEGAGSELDDLVVLSVGDDLSFDCASGAFFDLSLSLLPPSVPFFELE